jgi:hypothetical protein
MARAWPGCWSVRRTPDTLRSLRLSPTGWSRSCAGSRSQRLGLSMRSRRHRARKATSVSQPHEGTRRRYSVNSQMERHPSVALLQLPAELNSLLGDSRTGEVASYSWLWWYPGSGWRLKPGYTDASNFRRIPCSGLPDRRLRSSSVGRRPRTSGASTSLRQGTICTGADLGRLLWRRQRGLGWVDRQHNQPNRNRYWHRRTWEHAG